MVVWKVVDTAASNNEALTKILDSDDGSRYVGEFAVGFNPKITRIVDFHHEFGVTSITALTDRGKVTFQIKSRDDVRVLSPTRAFFRDVDGNTYELPDRSKLDSTSKRYLQRYF